MMRQRSLSSIERAVFAERINIEVGIEGFPAKRIYAWADVLEVPRDAFFRFATGEASSMVAASKVARDSRGDVLSGAPGS